MWNERYMDRFAAYGAAPNDFLRAVVRQIPSGPVLEIAAGEGRNAVFLAQLGYEVTAMDQSDVGLASARALAQDKGAELETQCADLADFDLGQSKWAGIVAIWAHLPPEVRARVHGACVRALQPGGVMVLEAYSPRQLEMPGKGGPPNVAMLVSPEDARREFSGLDFHLVQETRRVVEEGRYHSGLSATTQLLASKRSR